MDKQVKVVVGANAGDEGKGLVSRCLAEEAANNNRRILTVLYNGGAQRAHTVGDVILHNVGAGNTIGGQTYYHPMFLLDPIALFITQDRPIIDPMCRVVLPSDVLKNQRAEMLRGNARHGSCGMGIFECVKRSKVNPFYAREIWDRPSIVKAAIDKDNDLLSCEHQVYNVGNFVRACEWIKRNCRLASFGEITDEFDTIIYEGGQGLLLDQTNLGDFPHLTPSSVGAHNIAHDIRVLGVLPEAYYVSRTYMTRHGAGPMWQECNKGDINPDIVDKTNEPNEWQGSLRFGYINQEQQFKMIESDVKEFARNGVVVSPRLVYTHMNYTNGKLAVGKGKFVQIENPGFADTVYGSWDKTSIKKL